MNTDTITAISTALGEGGIAIVRVSGENAINIVDTRFKSKRRLVNAESHTINYGYFTDLSGNVIDEVLISIMRAPKTYTTEDIVEVNCHGGMIAARKILDVLLESGTRLAEPGEFTKRAFLNGRIDLAQAEAVIDLIRSKTDKAMSVAMKQVEGSLSRKIKDLRHTLLEILAHIEVTIDYPEHDVESVTHDFLLDSSVKVKQEIEKLLNTSNEGKILREGISTTIIGRPNVGKSSLLNALIRENRAIVTEIPGTTRDIIEEYINIRGIPLKLIDTAGIRETDDFVEKIGVERSRKALEDADLVLLVFNYNEGLSDDDLQLIKLVKDLAVIVVINKTDLPQVLEIDTIKENLKNASFIYTSVKEDKGIDDLEENIRDLFFQGKVLSGDINYVSNARHIDLLKKSKASIDDAIVSIDEWLPIDIIAIDIKNTWEHLGEIIGDAISDDLTNQIFSQFCVGK